MLLQEADAFRTAPFNGNRTRLAARTDPDHLLNLLPSFFRGQRSTLDAEMWRGAEWPDLLNATQPEHVPSTYHALIESCALACKPKLA